LDKVSQGFAKAMQKVDNQIFHDFPECSILGSTNRLSIKLKDPQLHTSLILQGPPSEANFNSITFYVRNEDNRKQIVMLAQLQSGSGVVLKNSAGKPIMLIRLPNHSADSLGKLMHPSVFTLYKVMRTPVDQNYIIVRSSNEEPVMRVERVLASFYPIGKAVGLLGSNCVYWLKSVDGTIIYGHIRPKLVMKSNTLVVKFMSDQQNTQLRATILGVALLLTITDVYPPLRTMLAESIQATTPVAQTSTTIYPKLNS